MQTHNTETQANTEQPALPASQVRRIQQTLADWTKQESDWLKQQIQLNHVGWEYVTGTNGQG